MSIRIPKAGIGTLGILALFFAILWIPAGGIDQDSMAAQDNPDPTPTPTSAPTSNVLIAGDKIVLENEVVISSHAFLEPLHLIDASGQPIFPLPISFVEIIRGESLLGALQDQNIEDLGVLWDFVKPLNQTVTIVFSVHPPILPCTAGLGSLLPLGTPIDANTMIELTIDSEGIAAQILPSVDIQTSGDQKSFIPDASVKTVQSQSISSEYGESSIHPQAEKYLYDQLVIAQGFGGNTHVNVRNLDPSIAPITSVRMALNGLAGGFAEKTGGGEGRPTYISSGDVNNDGSPDIVLSFGPILSEAIHPNIIVARDAFTKEVIGHSFVAFPSGEGTDANYNGGEIRTAVGDFIGSGIPQIAAAQGRGGNGMVRLYQYTGQPAPLAWEVVGQFYGLPTNLVIQGKGENEHIGLILAAGDLDNDGLDELI
ncbi:MAG: hypothetical protein ACP5I1_12165, partial [Candidatus Hinthialibacter sp.]